VNGFEGRCTLKCVGTSMSILSQSPYHLLLGLPHYASNYQVVRSCRALRSPLNFRKPSWTNKCLPCTSALLSGPALVHNSGCLRSRNFFLRAKQTSLTGAPPLAACSLYNSRPLPCLGFLGQLFAPPPLGFSEKRALTWIIKRVAQFRKLGRLQDQIGGLHSSCHLCSLCCGVEGKLR